MSDSTTTGSRTGWTCPVCGGGVAPDVKRCPCVETAPVQVFPYPIYIPSPPPVWVRREREWPYEPLVTWEDGNTSTSITIDGFDASKPVIFGALS